VYIQSQIQHWCITGKMKKVLILSLFLCSCTEVTSTTIENDGHAKGDAFRSPILTTDFVNDNGKRDMRVSYKLPDVVTLPDLPDTTDTSSEEVAEEIVVEIVEEIAEEIEEKPDLYPPGPYSLEVFGIMPDMVFYDPWEKTWLRLSEYYKHPEYKVLLIVSSAGWCGPCQKKAAELVELYDEYHPDGFEVAYTMLQSFDLLDWIFVNPDNEEADLFFMEQWKEIPLYYGKDKPIQYPLYANPYQEFSNYFPGGSYGIPLSILITTKDMGIRYMQQGFAPNILENKIMLNLYNEPPDLPFE